MRQSFSQVSIEVRRGNGIVLGGRLEVPRELVDTAKDAVGKATLSRKMHSSPAEWVVFNTSSYRSLCYPPLTPTPANPNNSLPAIEFRQSFLQLRL